MDNVLKRKIYIYYIRATHVALQWRFYYNAQINDWLELAFI